MSGVQRKRLGVSAESFAPIPAPKRRNLYLEGGGKFSALSVPRCRALVSSTLVLIWCAIVIKIVMVYGQWFVTL